MNPQISKEEIKAANEYLLRVRRRDLDQDIRRGSFSDSDLRNTYPVLMKLLEFARLNLKSDEGKNYDYMFEAGQGNPNHTFDTSLKRPEIFESIAESYVETQKGKEMDDLFNKKIAEMNGYEFQLYLQQIGLIR